MHTLQKRFFMILATSFSVTLLPIFILNLVLLSDTLGSNQKTLLASQWQQRTHGVTYAPTLSETHLFKTLRLNDRLPNIDTLVFGSSTVMGITQQAFPSQFRIYNYAQTGHPLSAVLDEAEYIQQHATHVKWMIIPMDWSLAFIFQHATPSAVDLSVAAAMQQAQSPSKSVPLLDRMRDALSYPRIASLMDIFKSILRADNSLKAFRGYFIQGISDEYRCADGTPGKDFDSIYRGTCTGFRYDGSATFANSSRVSNTHVRILTATSSSSIYRQNLAKTEGVPDALLLQRLAELNAKARKNGGGVILFMPPLLPGLEAEFMRQPKLATLLQNTKRIIDEWAHAQHLVVLDAGQSERFGCTADEFIDEHHSVSTCYEKIFKPFWQSVINRNDTITLTPDGLR